MSAWRTPALNTPQRDIMLVPGSLTYWQSDCAISLREEAKFFGYTSRVTLGGEDVRLLVPTTFMNLSGKAVAAMASFFRINPDEILVARRTGSASWRRQI